MEDGKGKYILVAEAASLANSFPLSLLQLFAASIADCDLQDWPSSKIRITQSIPNAHYRNLASSFLDTWRAEAEELSPEAVALALLTAAQCEKARREDQSVELVWTGPDVGSVPLRRTEQVLLQLIGSATRRILIVSYAVYNIPGICEALIDAADRGVLIDIVVETPDRLQGENTYSTLKALGESVANKSSVFFWPLKKRGRDSGGKPGILHVKCAVADGRWLFLSSANLTQYAFTLNMELGMLITGGPLPEQVAGHFQQMIKMGVLKKL